MATVYEIIGRRIEIENPRYFNQLKADIGYVEPITNNLNDLPIIRDAFCRVRDISTDFLTSKTYDRKATFERQLCMTVCYRLFYPNIFILELKQSQSRQLNSAISSLLAVNRKKIGEKIEKSLFSYCYCRVFKEMVDDICDKIKCMLYDNANKDIGTTFE